MVLFIGIIGTCNACDEAVSVVSVPWTASRTASQASFRHVTAQPRLWRDETVSVPQTASRVSLMQGGDVHDKSVTCPPDRVPTGSSGLREWTTKWNVCVS